MAEDRGFLAQLTGGAADERAVAQERIGADVKQGGRMAQMFYGLGQQIGGGLGTIGAGLIGGVRGGEGEGFKERFHNTALDAENSVVAQLNGITPTELKARRAVRSGLAEGTFEDDKDSSARYKMAERAYEISKSMGDSAGAARALAMMRVVQEQDQAFASLQQEASNKAVTTAYAADGSPVSGRITKNDEGLYVLESATKDGQLIQTPFGSDLSLVNPKRMGDYETLDQAIRRGIGTTQRNAIENQISTQASTMRQSNRVIKSLMDYGDQANQIISKSGEVVQGIDNFVRNGLGLLDTFFAGAQKLDEQSNVWRKDAHGVQEYWSGRQNWKEKANNPSDAIWDMFPENVREVSAQAQQHRARIMEMAYMAARMAEPSNRGLSDNDIHNALRRIAGDSSNPQVIARRFVEMIGDGMFDIEAKMGIYAGRFEKIATKEEIYRAIGGHTYEKLFEQRDKLFKDIGVTLNEDGRAVFANPIDSDTNPADTAPVDEEGGESREAFLQRLNLTGE